MAITQMIPAVWSARILEKLQQTLVFAQPGVVNKDYEGDIAAEGDRVHINSFNDLTVANYVRNSTVVSYQELTDTRQTLLIDQSKYFAFKVDDVDHAQMKPKLIDAASARAAYQLALTADSYVSGLYTGASAAGPDNTIEATQFTNTNVYQKFVDLAVAMDTGNIPPEGRYAVVPPWIKGLLLRSPDFLAAQSEAVLNGEVGQVAGIRILVSNSVRTTGTAPIVSHIMAGVPGAIAFAEQIVKTEGIRLEGAFADGVRGLYLYGAKVIDAAQLFNLQANA